MPNMFCGYVVRLTFDDQSVSIHGPFFTEERAKKYATSSNRIVDFTIEELTIPHSLRVHVEER